MELPLWFRLAFCVPSFLWGVFYFRRATRQGRFIALAMVVVVLYGFVVEYYDIRSVHSYDYARMLVMLGAWPDWVPLSICVSWAAILFVVTSISDRLGLPWYQRPFLDGLIATSMDLVGDPVFSNSRRVLSLGGSCADANSPVFGGIGVWTWCVPTNDNVLWVSVPMGNFFGWFLVVFGFSFLLRVAQFTLDGEKRPWPVQLAMLLACAGLSLVGVEVLLRLYMRLSPVMSGVVLGALLFLPLVLVFVQRRQLNFRNPFDLGIVLMPLVGNASDLTLFFQRGVARASGTGWTVTIVATAVAATLLALLPFAGTLFRRRATA